MSPHPRIIAPPPFGRLKPSSLSGKRLYVGLSLMLLSSAPGFSSWIFPEARIWLMAVFLVLLISGIWILKPLRLLIGDGRDPKSLYGHKRI